VNVTVVLPCLNEEAAVGGCVRTALASIARAGWTGEVVVVDNGSTDGSAVAAEAAGARVVGEDRPGYGRALRTGFRRAQGDIVVMADADGTYDLERLEEVVGPVMAGDADMVLATRLEGATTETMPFLHRYLGTPVITFLTSRACGQRVTSDSQTGYRAFRRADLPAMDLAGTGMELASEMLIKSSRAGLRIAEVPVEYKERIGESKLNTWSDGWRHLMLIFGLAPDLLLIGPGASLTGVGLAFLVLAFMNPSGIEIGSARWQPLFLAGVALVMGVQAVLAGLVISTESPIAYRSKDRRAGRWLEPLPVKAFVLGVVLILCGLSIDVGLFFSWLGESASPTTGPRLGFATVASTCLILGGTFATFGVVLRFVRSRPGARRAPSAAPSRVAAQKAA
jgi:glycosyltransferase involved in cell wall biosynthesis